MALSLSFILARWLKVPGLRWPVVAAPFRNVTPGNGDANALVRFRNSDRNRG